MNVLIVDDDPLMSRSLARLMRKMEFDVDVCDNCFAAATFLKEAVPTPRVIILDLLRPSMGGHDFIKYCRYLYGSSLRILVLSGCDAAQLERAVSVGADKALSKPCDKAQLLQAVTELMVR